MPAAPQPRSSPPVCWRSPPPAAAATTRCAPEVPGPPADVDDPGVRPRRRPTRRRRRTAPARAATAARPTSSTRARRRRPTPARRTARAPDTGTDDATPAAAPRRRTPATDSRDERHAAAGGLRRGAVRGLLRPEPGRLLTVQRPIKRSRDGGRYTRVTLSQGRPAVLDSTSRRRAAQRLDPLHRVARAATQARTAGRAGRRADRRAARAARASTRCICSRSRRTAPAARRRPAAAGDRLRHGARATARPASRAWSPAARRCTCPTRAVRRDPPRAGRALHASRRRCSCRSLHDDEVRRVAILHLADPARVHAGEIADAETLAPSAAAGFARLEAEHRRAARAAQDRALVRAARALNMSLELQRGAAHAGARGRARRRRRPDRGLPRQRARGRRRHRRATTWRTSGTGCGSRPARARPAQALLTGRDVRDQRLPARRRRGPRPLGHGRLPHRGRRPDGRGTTSSRARCRSAGPRCAGSRRRTGARSRRSPTSPPSPATTPRPTTRSSRPRAPTR